MDRLVSFIVVWAGREDGQDLLEYALLVALIALVCVGLIADLEWLAIAAGVGTALALAFWHGPRETGPVEPAP